MQIVVERIKAENVKTTDFNTAVLKVLAGVIKESRAILFEGNNYSEEWVKEAEKRGLANVASTVEALKAFVTKKAVDLFERQGVFTKVEIDARYIIWLDLYEKIIAIEAKTLAEIATTQVLPVAYEYQHDIAAGLELLKDVAESNGMKMSGALEDRKELLAAISEDIHGVRAGVKEMNAMLEKSHAMDLEAKTAFFFDEVKPQMFKIRQHVDALEQVLPDDTWLLPKYREMLFVC